MISLILILIRALSFFVVLCCLIIILWLKKYTITILLTINRALIFFLFSFVLLIVFFFSFGSFCNKINCFETKKNKTKKKNQLRRLGFAVNTGFDVAATDIDTLHTSNSGISFFGSGELNSTPSSGFTVVTCGNFGHGW